MRIARWMLLTGLLLGCSDGDGTESQPAWNASPSADAGTSQVDASPALEAGPVDAGNDVADGCTEGGLPERKSCTHDDDCVVAFRGGCCGGSYYAVHRESALVAAQNEACREPRNCAGLGCAFIHHAEDGTEIGDYGEVTAVCKQGMCASQANLATFRCGAQACAQGTVCERVDATFGSDAGFTYSCKPLPSGCTSCDCITNNHGYCNCRVSALGNFYRTCYPP